jgi:hypothetical protein
MKQPTFKSRGMLDTQVLAINYEMKCPSRIQYYIVYIVIGTEVYPKIGSSMQAESNGCSVYFLIFLSYRKMFHIKVVTLM